MRTLKFLASIGLLAILGAIAAGTYFLGGYYSVAGTAADSSLVAWALTHVRTASIARHAKDNKPTAGRASAWVARELVALFSSGRSRSVFWPFRREDIEIEYRFIAEHLAPMGDIRGNDN
jgi:hypothetical protein